MLIASEIKQALNDNQLDIQPWNEEQLNPNSYDLCLGNWFVEVTSRSNRANYERLWWVKDRALMPIRPGITVLGVTKEWISADLDLVGQLHSKSSTRRRGITICDDAGFGDIGYQNFWTVELSCHLDGPVGLEVGKPFAQISFTRVTKGTLAERYKGQYNLVNFPEGMLPKAERVIYGAHYRRAARLIDTPGYFDRQTSHVLFCCQPGLEFPQISEYASCPW